MGLDRSMKGTSIFYQISVCWKVKFQPVVGVSSSQHTTPGRVMQTVHNPIPNSQVYIYTELRQNQPTAMTTVSTTYRIRYI